MTPSPNAVNSARGIPTSRNWATDGSSSPEGSVGPASAAVGGGVSAGGSGVPVAVGWAGASGVDGAWPDL